MRKVTGYIGKAARFLLAAFIAVFCTFRGSFEIAEAEEKTPTFEIGSSSDATDFWTWRKVKTQEEMDNLWTTYSKYNSNTDVRIPIMLICTINGTRYMISCSQMVSSNAESFASDDEPSWAKWNWSYFYNRDRYTTVSYKNVAYKCADYEGLASTANSDVVISRGGYSPFYVAYHPTTLMDAHKKQTINFQYEFYQDAEQDSTDKILQAWRPDEDINSGTVRFDYSLEVQLENQKIPEEDKKTYLEMQDTLMSTGWQIKSCGNEKFNIYTYYFSPKKASDGINGKLVQQKVSFCVTSDSSNVYMRWHQGMVAYQNGGSNGGYQNADSGESYTVKSGDVEQFEIWYGVPGVTKDALDAVDGTKTGEVSASDQTIIQAEVVSNETSKSIASGSTYAVPDFTVLYIPKDQTMLIEEGATVIVGRNAVIVNNGTIENNGELIIQPGATILFDNTPMLARQDEDNSVESMCSRGYAIIKGTGDLIVRNGGKVRQNGLALSGDVYNSGLMCIEQVYKQPNKLTMNSGVLVLYYNTKAADYWTHGTDILCSNLTTRGYVNTDHAAYLQNAVSDVSWSEAIGTSTDSTVIIGKK